MDPLIDTTKYQAINHPFTEGSILYSETFALEKDGPLMMSEILAEVIRDDVEGRFGIELIDGAMSIEDLYNLQDQLTFIQVGHRTDPTQQSFIYYESCGLNGPLFDLYSGIDSPEKFRNTLPGVRIGNLDPIYDPDFPEDLQPQGVGFYGTNCFLKGVLVLTGGDTFDLIQEKINLDDYYYRMSLFDETLTDAAKTDRLYEATGKTGLFVGSFFDIDLINANDILAQNITAGGVITGLRYKTASSGTRLEMMGALITGYRSDGELDLVLQPGYGQFGYLGEAAVILLPNQVVVSDSSGTSSINSTQLIEDGVPLSTKYTLKSLYTSLEDRVSALEAA